MLNNKVIEIGNSLNCNKCKKIFTDPRVLPCGEFLCQKCIKLDSASQNTFLKCCFCDELHDIPKDGFPKSILLKKLIKKESDETHRNYLIDELKYFLDRIDSKINDAKYDINMSDYKLREHCDFLRFDIDVACESAIEYISKFRDELLDKVNSYENDCKRSFEENKELKEKVMKSIDEMELFSLKWQDYLATSLVDTQMLKSAINEANSKTESVNKNHQRLKQEIFNGKLIEFNQNQFPTQSSILGLISYKNLRPLFDIEDLVEINISNEIVRTRIKSIDFNFIENDYIVSMVLHETGVLNSFIIDLNGNVIGKCFVDVCSVRINFESKFYTLENLIIKYVVPVGNKNYLRIYDREYNGLKEWSIDYYVCSIVATKNNIYCLSKNPIIRVYEYTLNFNALVQLLDVPKANEFGQALNENENYFIPRAVMDMEVNEAYYFFINKPDDFSTEIRILNRDSGSLFKAFNLNGDHLSIYNDCILSSFNKSSKELCFYNLNGSLIEKSTINGINANLFRANKSKILFYDASKPNLFIHKNNR